MPNMQHRFRRSELELRGPRKEPQHRSPELPRGASEGAPTGPPKGLQGGASGLARAPDAARPPDAPPLSGGGGAPRAAILLSPLGGRPALQRILARVTATLLKLLACHRGGDPSPSTSVFIGGTCTRAPRDLAPPNSCEGVLVFWRYGSGTESVRARTLAAFSE
eukprot:4435078-Alexandrium_andersonii.AAC.1